MSFSKTNASSWHCKKIFEYFEHDSNVTLIETACLREILSYGLSLASCLSRLHALQITHRDVKPSNFLYSQVKNRGVIIDLGLCELGLKARELGLYRSEKKAFYVERILKIQAGVGKNKFGTEGYMPLETVLLAEGQTSAVDVWAFGVIFLQLLMRKQFLFCQMNLIVFDKSSQKLKKLENNVALFLIQLANFFGPAEVKAICNKFGFFVSFPSSLEGSIDKIRKYVRVESVSDGLLGFVKQMLSLDPQKRPDCKEIIAVFKKECLQI